MHFLHINSKYAEQNHALLETLRLHPSNNNRGHIVLYSTLLIGHTEHKGHMRVSSWPFVPKKLQQTNRQDMVFIRPPGISDGAICTICTICTICILQYAKYAQYVCMKICKLCKIIRTKYVCNMQNSIHNMQKNMQNNMQNNM